MRKVDLAIIGGGPAGISTALHLVRQEPSWVSRLVVIEKGTHPRPKLCAGGITQFGMRQIRRLGLTPKIPFVPVGRADFLYRGHAVQLRGKPIFIVTRREEFDAWLAQEAKDLGIELLEGNPVQSLARRAEGILIDTAHTRFLAKAVVGADGARGIVRPWIGARERPARVARLLEVVMPETRFDFDDGRRVATFDFDMVRDDLQGYYWNFPSLIGGQPYLNSGVYDSQVNSGQRKARLRELLSKGLKHHAYLSETTRIEGHPIRWFSPSNQVAAERILLAGDASGAEPLFGEGISIALAYGDVVASTVRRAFQKQDFSFNDYRRRLLTSPVGRYLLLRWATAQAFYRLAPRDRVMRFLWRTGELVTKAMR